MAVRPDLVEPRQLRLEDGARAVRDGLVVMVVDEVGEDDRRALEPGRLHQRGEVGLHDEIAIAAAPVGRLVAGHRLHVDVVGQQVVAAMRLVDGALEEELGLEALADQPSLHVGKGHEHGVDGAGFRRRP